jgi:hypothetical protein
MASTILLSIDRDRISVAPGASVDFSVKVQNLTTLLDQVAIRVDGVYPAWIQVVPPYLPVFAQGTASARVIVSPPAAPAQSPAGLYKLQVYGKPQENSGEEGQGSLELEVQLIGDYQAHLAVAKPLSQTETTFPLQVHNGANASLTLRFAGNDKGEALWYKFEPFQLVVPPGGDAVTSATIRVKQLSADKRAIAFNVSATGSFALQNASPLPAPAHQIAGQFQQVALASLMLTLNPTQVEGESNGIYDVRVGNPGASPVTVRLDADAQGSPLTFSFNPPLLSIGAQAEARSQLQVHAASAVTKGERRPYDFRLAAVATDGAALPAAINARFTQISARKPFPWMAVILLALLGLVMLCGILLLVIGQSGLFR